MLACGEADHQQAGGEGGRRILTRVLPLLDPAVWIERKAISLAQSLLRQIRRHVAESEELRLVHQPRPQKQGC